MLNWQLQLPMAINGLRSYKIKAIQISINGAFVTILRDVLQTIYNFEIYNLYPKYFTQNIIPKLFYPKYYAQNFNQWLVCDHFELFSRHLQFRDVKKPKIFNVSKLLQVLRIFIQTKRKFNLKFLYSITLNQKFFDSIETKSKVFRFIRNKIKSVTI